MPEPDRLISDDPEIPFRVSHATTLASLKAKVDSLDSWAKVGVSGGLGLLAAILVVLLMR